MDSKERESKEKEGGENRFLSLAIFLPSSSSTLAASTPSNRDQMARALCSTAALAATLSDGIAVLISRRGYAGAAAVTGTAASRGRSAEEKVARKGTVVGSGSSSSSSNSWVPDPITGYYRPGNRPAEVDAAELREALLPHRSRR